ncbi:hypothetical protein [Massilia rhizosphaerae]|uniref:hypothetical protein n=1 Tax=Massilia rhizosphaerae TaxID=2784389 RepID=UPI0018DB3B3A|nr:hypothetical protein [Massilia rhizosphaerae]
MPREELLEELTDNFPPKNIYTYDEDVRYTYDRKRLMDEVLLGTFESYVRHVEDEKFSYKITADKKFCLEVKAEGERWIKIFDYVTDAFDIGEAAYRFFIVMPRALDEGEVILEAERNLVVDQESRDKHDHCDYQEEQKKVEIIMPPNFTAQGATIKATVYLCTDGSYILTVAHFIPGRKKRRLLDQFYSDPDFAALLAAEYVKQCDTTEFLGIEEELYQRVYKRVTH